MYCMFVSGLVAMTTLVVKITDPTTQNKLQLEKISDTECQKKKFFNGVPNQYEQPRT